MKIHTKAVRWVGFDGFVGFVGSIGFDVLVGFDGFVGFNGSIGFIGSVQTVAGGKSPALHWGWALGWVNKNDWLLVVQLQPMVMVSWVRLS